MDAPTDVRPLLLSMQASVAAAVRRFADVHAVGPFLVGIDRTSDMIWINYALPAVERADDEQIASALPGVRRVFADHARVPRFEFFRGLWPTLGATLARAGYVLQQDMPLMAAGRGDLRDVASPGVTVERVTAEATDGYLRLLVEVGQLAFGEWGSQDPAEAVAGRREMLAQGLGTQARASIEGRVVGVATLMHGGPVSEIVGVGTHPDFRRRGVATALTRFLCDLHFDQGGEVAWLSAADEAARRVYAKVGFRDVGVQAHYIDRAWK
jgi:ribosomal protein S18 acetylase RimI-like enzyme